VMAVSLADNVKARLLQKDGSYRLATRPEAAPVHRSQLEFIELARAAHGERATPKEGKTGYPRVKLAHNPHRARKPKP
ncbi:MAG: RNA degradosome polyphosphate kinase, partial [Verrucomicrobia bacterium]|nr:RNA degradosome polyphosphate kinase [Verrucomicrobiota bacterium]